MEGERDVHDIINMWEEQRRGRTMIQIDMPMPESCDDCPARDDTYDACPFFDLRGHEDWCSNFMRPDTCPLREVKEGQKDKYVAWPEKQIISQTEKSYPEMVLAIYDAGYAYDAIHHLLKLLEEEEKNDT